MWQLPVTPPINRLWLILVYTKWTLKFKWTDLIRLMLLHTHVIACKKMTFSSIILISGDWAYNNQIHRKHQNVLDMQTSKQTNRGKQCEQSALNVWVPGWHSLPVAILAWTIILNIMDMWLKWRSGLLEPVISITDKWSWCWSIQIIIKQHWNQQLQVLFFICIC